MKKIEVLGKINLVDDVTKNVLGYDEGGVCCDFCYHYAYKFTKELENPQQTIESLYEKFQLKFREEITDIDAVASDISLLNDDELEDWVFVTKNGKIVLSFIDPMENSEDGYSDFNFDILLIQNQKTKEYGFIYILCNNNGYYSAEYFIEDYDEVLKNIDLTLKIFEGNAVNNDSHFKNSLNDIYYSLLQIDKEVSDQHEIKIIKKPEDYMYVDFNHISKNPNISKGRYIYGYNYKENKKDEIVVFEINELLRKLKDYVNNYDKIKEFDFNY